MATLNTTPDSFSDGSTHNTLSTGLEYVRDAVSAGASIIDIGGYSTRPGAEFVSVEEEIDRVVPYVKAIRTGEAQGVVSKDVLISVDTFRPEVAEAAVAAGANCINDVYAFTGKDSFDLGHGDKEAAKARAQASEVMQKMKKIARRYATPVVLMHSRGDAGKHKDCSAYNYAGTEDAVIEGIRNELGAKVNRIVRGEGAVRRWSIIIDPGVGFSKTLEGNLQILRNADRVTADQVIGEGLFSNM
jgi:dihydropteroate synthase